MEDPIDEIRKQIMESFSSKKSEWEEKVYNCKQYQQEIKYLNDITKDFIDLNELENKLRELKHDDPFLEFFNSEYAKFKINPNEYTLFN